MASKKAPGRSTRKGISMIQAMRMFPHDAAAEQWFIRVRWPQRPQCPHCGAGSHRVQSGAKHKTMPFRCRACRKRFSVRSGTVMQHSNLGYQVWAMAIYLFMTSLKSVSSMKLHRDLNIAQNSAWHLSHRIRAALCQEGTGFAGPVEVDETYLGGKRKNMPNSVRKQLTGRGPVGKTAVVGAKDRATNQVAAKAVPATDKATLQGFVQDHADRQATVYTDEAGAYETLPFEHESVKHSVSEYVRGQAHTNGVESFWSMLKRGYYGTFHKLSPKHLDRYVQEFAGRHNLRERDTIDMMGAVVLGMDGKRLKYEELIRDNGLDSGALG